MSPIIPGQGLPSKSPTETNIHFQKYVGQPKKTHNPDIELLKILALSRSNTYVLKDCSMKQQLKETFEFLESSLI